MMTKSCTNKNCRETNPQPLNNFHKKTGAPDGLAFWCKSCKARAYREWAETETGKKSIARAKAKYRKTEKNRAAQRRYLQTEQGKVTHRKAARKYRKRHKRKSQARKAVNHAVESGSIPPVHKLACVECGVQAQEYHHHEGYNEERWLDVVPMCAMCHRQLN